MCALCRAAGGTAPTVRVQERSDSILLLLLLYLGYGCTRLTTAKRGRSTIVVIRRRLLNYNYY